MAAAVLRGIACRNSLFSVHPLGWSAAFSRSERHLPLLRRRRLPAAADRSQARTREIHCGMPRLLASAGARNDVSGARRDDDSAAAPSPVEGAAAAG